MANRKLAKLPNRVALASLVLRMPSCQAARSAAKNSPPSAQAPIIAQPGEGRPRPWRIAMKARNGTASASRQKAGGDRPDIGEPHHPRPGGQEQIGEEQRRKGEAGDRAIRVGDDVFHDSTGASGVVSRASGRRLMISSRRHVGRQPPLNCSARLVHFTLQPYFCCVAHSSKSLPMPSLFDPIKLGAVDAPNRVLMAPLTRGRADPRACPDRTDENLLCPARGRGPDHHRGDRHQPPGPGLALCAGHLDRRTGRGVETDHRGGARGRRQIFCQLWHMGRLVHPELPWRRPAGLVLRDHRALQGAHL